MSPFGAGKTEFEWQWQEESNQFYWEAGFSSLLGYADDVKLTAEFWRQQIHPKDRYFVWKKIQQLREKKERRLQLFYHLLNAYKQYVGVFHTIHFTINEQKLSTDFTGTLQIVADSFTETQDFVGQNLLSLGKSQLQEDNFEELADCIPHVVWLADNNMQPYYYNTQWYHYLGQHVSTPFNCLPNIICHEDLFAFNVACENALGTGIGFSFECRFFDEKNLSGYRWFYIKVSPLQNEQDEVLKWIGTCTDIDELKRSIEEQKKLITLIENSSDFIGLADVQANVFYVNKGGLEMVGLSTKEEACKHSILDYYLPEDLPQIKNAISQIIQQGEWVGDDRWRHFKTGKEIPISIKTIVLKDGNTGEPQAIAAIARDLTERKLAEQAIRESESRFRKLADSAPVMIWMSNEVGEIIYANQAWSVLIGENVFNTPKKNWMDLVHPDDLPKVKESCLDCIRYQTELCVKFRFKRFNGEYRWLVNNTAPRMSEQQKMLGLVGACIDITEQVTVQTVLRENILHVRSILEGLPQIAWTANGNGVIDYFTKTWFAYSGQTLTDAVNGSWKNVIHEKDKAVSLPFCKAAMEKGTPFEVEMRLKRAQDGAYRWHLIRGVPVENTDGTITIWAGTCTDIHVQKRIAEELEDRVQQRTKDLVSLNIALERSNKELEQFAYIASHDLQEPLRKIHFFTDMLAQQAKGLLEAETLQLLQKIIKSSLRMKDLLVGLLNYSTLTKREDILFEKVNLQELFDRVEQDLEIVIQQKQAEVSVRQPLPIIEAVELQMNQLFYNLLSNSIKFSAENRKPVITITNKVLSDLEKEQLQLDHKKSYCKIVFKDNGIGFSQEYANRIFIIFQRLNTPSKYPGTGIGLAICKKVVENHKGLIFAHSREGYGTTFTIILPTFQERDTHNSKPERT